MHEIIVVTDGDPIACEAVSVAAKELGVHVISASGGHPTKLSGKEIADLVYQVSSNPVIVFLDDRGDQFQGRGETALEELTRCPDIEVIGAIAVASEARLARGVTVHASVASTGDIVPEAVDKHGRVVKKKNAKLKGDTVDMLEKLDIPVIIGLGDPGKQYHHDEIRSGAPLTKKALEEILKRSNRDG